MKFLMYQHVAWRDHVQGSGFDCGSVGRFSEHAAMLTTEITMITIITAITAIVVIIITIVMIVIMVIIVIVDMMFYFFAAGR